MATCDICGKTFPEEELIPYEAIRPKLVRLIHSKYPHFNEGSRICLEELNNFRCSYVRQMLEADMGEISVLDEEVIKSIQSQDLVTSNLNEMYESDMTLGERLADLIAAFGGSWSFIITFAVFLGAWVAVNTVILTKSPPDPYPFIFLNLLLSCLAAIQAPLIMMSQNRVEKKRSHAGRRRLPDQFESGTRNSPPP